MKKIDNNECLSNFGKFIKDERIKKGLSQGEVALLVGIHRTHYGKIESATREVNLVMAMKICNALNIDLSDFIKAQMK